MDGSGFNFISRPSIESQLFNDSQNNRYLNRSINPARLLPTKIGRGAQFADKTSVLFFANASAGNFSTQIELNLSTVPLALVWFLGSIDKNEVVTPGGGLVPGSSSDSGTVLQGMEVSSGAIANYSCDKDNLTIKITSTNVGWPVFVNAYFYYAVYYDDVGIARLGL